MKVNLHHSQAFLALLFCCLSASILLNFTQRKAMSAEPVGALMIPDRPRSPKLVWLMSWPNSGTSYTLRQMERLSNYSMASNYGTERDRKGLVYKNLPEGPHCRGANSSWPHPIPDDYVLVKTHCMGYGTNDGAGALKRNPKDFVNGCATTRTNDKTGLYDTSLVHKAVHVVRNPFHNLVSRFNCEHKLQVRRPNGQGLSYAKKYPKNVVGFRKFCHDLDADFEKQYSKGVIPESIRHHAKHTMCHDDIIAYVQWHNHAFEAARKLQLPTLVVHYEDFEDDLNMTFTNLLDFMHLSTVGMAAPFTPSHAYDAYFTSGDRKNIKVLVKEFASNRTWNELSRYFVE